MTLNSNKYHYFQGYHDIGLYFLLLYLDDIDLGLNLFQRVTEFYLKQYLVLETNNSFDLNEILILLNETMNFINYEDYKHISQYFCYGGFYFALSWLITLFTHNIKNAEKIYRLFDILFTSHPLFIYILTSLIILDEFDVIVSTKDVIIITKKID